MDGEVGDLNQQIDDLRLFELEYRSRLRAFVTSHLDSLNDCERTEWPRQEIIGPEWSLIVPGWEIRANGNGTNGRVCIEIRRAE